MSFIFYATQLYVNKAFYFIDQYSPGRGFTVGIATCYRLDGPGIKSRWGARFSVLVRTGPGAHPPPIQWLTVLFLGDGVDHPNHPAPKIKKVYRNISPPQFWVIMDSCRVKLIRCHLYS